MYLRAIAAIFTDSAVDASLSAAGASKEAEVALAFEVVIQIDAGAATAAGLIEAVVPCSGGKMQNQPIAVRICKLLHRQAK